MTEPGIGSDLASMGTSAIRDGDRYVVNGSKTFITNGINADLVITAVKTDPTQRHKGMSLIVLERGMEGFERGRNLDKVGLHSQDTAELFFTDVQVPVANLLGTEGQGFVHLVHNLPQERLSIAAAGVAAAEAAFGWTLEYVKDRKAFGQPVGSFQNSRFKLAEMRTEIDIAQAFVDRCIEGLNDGTRPPPPPPPPPPHPPPNPTPQPHTPPPQHAHRRGGRRGQVVVHGLQKRVVDTPPCVQLHGGHGYMLEYVLPARPGPLTPDAPASPPSTAGTTEIMKEIVGRSLGV